MKYILLTIAVSISLIVNGQDCNDYTFSTYPNTAVNTQDPAHINLDFDWTDQVFDFYNLGNWGTGSSPFFQTNGNPYMTHFHESQDKDSEDGWELLFYDFGTQIKLDDETGEPVINNNTEAYEVEPTPDTEANNPTFILYNRYTGIARVFARVQQQFGGYTMARIKLYFVNAGGQIQTSLINDHNTLLPLDQFFADPSYDSPVAFINTQGKWFYTDFFMNYDPCTCDFESELRLEVRLIEEATIDLKGQTNGDIVSVTNKATVNDKAGNAFSIGGKALLSGNADFQKTLKGFKDIDDFRAKQFKEINKHLPTQIQQDYKDKVTLFQQALVDNEFMRDALEIVPYVSTALAFVDLFVGGGKKDSSSDPIELHPLTMQSMSEYYGTITSNQLYIAQDFWLPGSDNVNRPIRKRPWYNKTLGVFNLITTPSVKFNHYYTTEENYEERVIEETRNCSIEFTDDLDYVINYNAGFDATNFPDIEGELVFEFDEPIHPQLIFEDHQNLIHDVVGSRVITKRVPISCINDAFDLSFSIKQQLPLTHTIPSIIDIKIKLYVNLRRADADDFTQNVLFVGAYPLNIILDNNINLTSNPFANIQDVINLENTVITSDIRAWETINIGENVIFQPPNGSLLNITAGKEVNILSNTNGTQIFQNTRIKTENLFANTCKGTNPPQTESQIRSFCASNTYQKEERGFLKNANAIDNEKLKVTAQFSVLPNPTTTFVNIESGQSYQLNVFNMLGQQVRLQNGAIGTQQLNMMGFEAGIYFFAFEFEDGTRETVKVIKQ
ncbi:MAG: T9SS type A sorting domain-containing protein [Saprospiraceae bacterium]